MSIPRKIAIVTGANKGIGYAIVRNLVLRSAAPLLVYATARDPSRGTQAVSDLKAEKSVATALENKSSDIEFRQLDISDLDSIQKFKNRLKAEHGEESLSILINNAGVVSIGHSSDPNAAREILSVNYWGTKNIIDAILPLMRKDGEGRIINLVSLAGSIGVLNDTALGNKFKDKALKIEQLDGLMEKFVDDVAAGSYKQQGWPTDPTNSYKVSKIGVTALTKIQARNHKSILINAANPGIIRTDMTGEWAQGTPDEGSRTPVHLALEDLNGISGEFWSDERVIEW